MGNQGTLERLGKPQVTIDANLKAALKEVCPVREVLDRIGDKWSVQVVFHLSQQGTLRFSELRRRIDRISHRMLTATLRGLERDGLVSRTQFSTIPPRVEYALTPMGATLLDPIQALERWARENRLAVSTARAAYDARRPAMQAAPPSPPSPPSIIPAVGAVTDDGDNAP